MYFLPLRLLALCWVETTTLVQPTGLPSTYWTVTWLLASGCRSNSLSERRLSDSTLQDLVSEVDRGRHERALLIDLALGAGEAEHHALVAGAFLLAALLLLGVDAHGDVGRLAVQQHLDVRAMEGEAVLVVADVLDHIAGDLGDLLAVDDGFEPYLLNRGAWPRPSPAITILLVVVRRLAAQAGVHLAVVGDAEFDVVLEKRVENGVGDLIARPCPDGLSDTDSLVNRKLARDT